MKLTKIAFLLTLWGFIIPIQAAPVLAQEPVPVLAFYYAWFDQNTWSSGQSVDVPVQPYTSADRAIIEQHVAQAQNIGINALVQSWYGPQVENNQTETNFRTLLDVAQSKGFQAAVDFETMGPFFADATAVTNALNSLIATHAQHPAYLRYQGKPVIFFWRQQRFSVDEWQAMRDQIDPNRNTYWIAEGVEIAYQDVFDGHHLYSIAWAGSPAGQLAKWGNRVRDYESQNQTDRLWVATAMPGYNDTRLPRADTFSVDRRKGDYYRETWQAAVASTPDMIIITSFNEWLEGSQLEPSASYGNLYLDITRELVTGVPATVAKESLETDVVDVQPATLQEPPLNGPYIQTEGVTNVRRGPDTAFDIVGRLEADSTAVVVGRLADDSWWQIELAADPEGAGWVSAEVVEFVGEASSVPVVEAPAAPTVEAEESPSGTNENGTDTNDGLVVETGATLVIPAGGVNVRSGPGLDFDLLGRLDEGDELAIVAKNNTGEWWQVEYQAGENGLAWLADVVVDVTGDTSAIPVVSDNSVADEATTTPIPVESVISGSVEATDPINVRSEPSTTGIIWGGLYPGESADVLARDDTGEWWQIEFADSLDGPAWVSAEFVRFTGELNSVPIFGIGTVTPTPGPTNTPTSTPIPTATPTIVLNQPTFAPTATSLYQATSEAMLSDRDPAEAIAETEPASTSSFSWDSLPWGILAILFVVVFIWYQFVYRRSRKL